MNRAPFFIHFTCLRLKRLTAAGLLVLYAWAPVTGISAQNVTSLPVRPKEKRPTPENPSYLPPLIPPSLRNSMNSMNPATMLNPGALDAKSFRKSQEEQALLKKKRKDRKFEYELKNIPEGNERAVFERSLLHQFGTDVFPEYAGRHDPYYTETSLRRFQIIFFLSLPVTAAGTYGTAQLIRSAQGQKMGVYDGPSTAAMVAVSLLLSGGIAWYDHIMWKKDPENLSRLLLPETGNILKQDQKNEELQVLSQSQLTPSPADPFLTPDLKIFYAASF